MFLDYKYIGLSIYNTLLPPPPPPVLLDLAEAARDAQATNWYKPAPGLGHNMFVAGSRESLFIKFIRQPTDYASEWIPVQLHPPFVPSYT